MCKLIDISVIVPLLNEEENIELLFNSISAATMELNRPYEIIFVDDGSTDDTFQKAKAIHEKDKRLKVIKFRKNYGQTPAMQAGFDKAKGSIVISMDGDMQNDPADIPQFIKKIEEGYDLVCGWRKNRQDTLLTRKIPSKIANKLIAFLTGIPIHDNGCSLKAFRQSVLKKTRLYSEMHRFIPAMASLSGVKIAEIVVNHRARTLGQSKYGLSRIWKVALDLFFIKMLVGSIFKPIVWFGTMSLPFLFAGVIFLVYSMNYYLIGDADEYFPLILPAVSLLFIYTFFQLFFLGLFSELIVHTGEFRQKEVISKEFLTVC